MAEIRYAMVIDMRKCIGCHACSVACKSENAVPLGVWRNWVKQIEKGKYPNVRVSFLPRLCNNCDKPPCVQVCPVRATWKRRDGIVVINPHICIGCRYCIMACPYDARYINPFKKIAQKCEWCVHRVDAGMAPACVVTCPTGALVFGNLNDPDSEVARLLSTNPVEVLKPQHGTEPHVFYLYADRFAMKTIYEHARRR